MTVKLSKNTKHEIFSTAGRDMDTMQAGDHDLGGHKRDHRHREMLIDRVSRPSDGSPGIFSSYKLPKGGATQVSRLLERDPLKFMEGG
jgi:hypothetical protein